MGFLHYKMCLTGTVVFTLIYMSATAESLLKQSDGLSVLTGCPCLPGRDGRDGRDGIQGPYGPPGIPGNVGMSAEYERKFEEMLSSIEELKDALSNGPLKPGDKHREQSSTFPEQSSTGGATYVRWGRNVCPPKTLKLYSGFVAGSHYTHAGSGANHLCLPTDPQWNRTVSGLQSGAYLYGTEFEIPESNFVFHRSNAGGKSRHDHEAQCAVCQTPGRLTQLMIPARLECPTGWSLEYLGFLMAGHSSHKRSEYVCVDQDPDVDPATSADKNGNLLYQVEVACGSLPCPPYVDGYEVTCVVCTQ